MQVKVGRGGGEEEEEEESRFVVRVVVTMRKNEKDVEGDEVGDLE